MSVIYIMKRFSKKNKADKKHPRKRKSIKRRRTKKIVRGGMLPRFFTIKPVPPVPPDPTTVEEFFDNLDVETYKPYRIESTNTLSTRYKLYHLDSPDRYYTSKIYIRPNVEILQITAGEYKFLTGELQSEFDAYYKSEGVLNELKNRYSSLELNESILPIYDLAANLSYLNGNQKGFLNENNSIGVFFEYSINDSPKYFIFTFKSSIPIEYNIKRVEQLLNFLQRKLQKPETINVFIKFKALPPDGSRAPTTFKSLSHPYLENNAGYLIKDIVGEGNLGKLHNLFKFIIPKLGQKPMDNLNGVGAPTSLP